MRKKIMYLLFWVPVFLLGCQTKNEANCHYPKLIQHGNDEILFRRLKDIPCNFELYNIKKDSITIKFDDYTNLYTNILTYVTLKREHIDEYFEGKVVKDLELEMTNPLYKNDDGIPIRFYIQRWTFDDEQLSRAFNDIFYLYDYNYKSSKECNNCFVNTLLHGKTLYFIRTVDSSVRQYSDVLNVSSLLSRILYSESKLLINNMIIDSKLDVQK